MKYICLRDDDTSFLTAPEQLQVCYGEFWGVLPVTLATIPFLHGSSGKINEFGYEVPNPIKQVKMREWQKNASFEELRSFHSFSPVGENNELVSYLKPLIKAEKVEIAQHGVFHRYNEQGAEMQKSQMSFEWVRDGKEYLEKVFDIKVSTFIPPANTIDKHCLDYLKKLELHLFTSGVLTTHSKAELYCSYLTDPKWLVEKIKSKLSKKQRPIQCRFGNYLFNSITYDAFKSQEQIYNSLLRSLESTGFAALGTHYEVLLDFPEYRKNYHDLLRKLAALEDVQFVTAKKYYELLLKQYYE